MLVLLGAGYGDARSAQIMVIAISGSALLVIAVASWKTARQRRLYEHALVQWHASQAVHEERMRIARELHDLASHGLGAITVRAAAGQVSADPSCHLDALIEIEHTSREATVELRRMLRLLREPTDSSAPLHPIDNQETLTHILAEGRARGQRITSTIADLSHLSAGAQLAVCSTVREGLLNAHQHAGNTDIHVSVARLGHGVVVSTEDSGPSSGWHTAPGTGYGLVGLSERLAVVGGSLDVSRSTRGFTLVATIPDEDNR